jgi:SAM-dependent methyltransferase
LCCGAGQPAVIERRYSDNMSSILGLIKWLLKKMLPNRYQRCRDVALDFWYLVRFREYREIRPFVKNLTRTTALEIGGPSWIFKTKIPVYRYLRQLKLLQPPLQRSAAEMESASYYWLFRKGERYTGEATRTGFNNSSFSLILNSHVLEHIANPIRALREWYRILEPNGYVFTVVPSPEGTFDQDRPITTFDHILADYRTRKDEDDKSHIEEIVLLTRLDIVKSIQSVDFFYDRCKNNVELRYMHHHVFDLKLLKNLFVFCRFHICFADTFPSGHFIIARK